MIEDVLAAPAAEHDAIERMPPPPVLGDVLDSLDDAAASLKRVARNEARALLHDVRARIRARPIKAVALAAGLAFLLGRLAR
jgi:ElaB/YqjD/DUF883 family membrane-anchored ribosome-binding protein